MKNNILNLSKLSVLGATLALVTAGCETANYQAITPLGGKHKTDPSFGTDDPLASPDKMVTATLVTTTNVAPDKVSTAPAWNEDRFSLSTEKVYFDFDISAIKAGEQSKLDDVANFLKGNLQVNVRIEGNCDEIGTEEYNRELGQRRAAASRDYLVKLGIEPARIQTLSYGRDNPVGARKGNKARALNRRDEFVVLTPDNIL